VFGNWLRHFHGFEISPFSDREQVVNSQSQFLKPVVHFLEMEIKREKPFEFVLHRG